MKKIIVLAIFTFIIGLPTVGFSADEGKVYKLKIADPFPTNHPLNKIVHHFMELGQKYSNGRLEFTYYPAQQLGKLKDLPKLCQQGMTDIAYIGLSFFPGQFGLNLVINLPYYTTAEEGSKIYMKLIKTSPELQQEWSKNKVYPITLGVTNQYDVGSVKGPLNKPEDLKGLRCRVAGGLFEATAKRYGIIPVTMSSNEVYEGLQRGIVDGTILSLPSIKGYNLQELEKYHTLGMRMGGFCGVYAVNEKTLKKLPPDLQEALKKAGAESTIYFAKVWDGMVQQLYQAFEKGGMTFTLITPENRAVWDAPLKGIEEDWISKYEAMGLPARKVFEQFKTIALEIAK